ncbi:hypothetical protein HA466_0064170 [Hirschfeldia incana]|nr:hypothetical protein HA466_0277060 [Hirschfeldia incana]KAJ0234173.1 hypothetical protein HA466_0277060 [Hirschfeldia incana]KAJ0234174.1 hypothetical protein HA466_0277060 [Hirschfeldia incana]KAJ0234175.1 hypothetical protein HA466_0277060 [Hirschfeldia incana]KAJ0234176.1 hypothetical protein HA466_0277060 [Hirschfeldia incana]
MQPIGTIAANDHTNVSPTVPSLRLEAKLRAEEDSRRSAGKQVHPFFSSWKGGKKNQEAAAAAGGENGGCQEQGKDKIVTTIGPIHVFERFEDVNQTIDWKNWTFVEQSSTTWSPGEPIKSDSLTHRLKEFDLNELPVLSHPDVCVIIDDEEPVQCVTQSEGIAAASPVVLISYQEASDKAEGVVDCEAHEAVMSNRVGGAADISHELRSMSCRESGQPRNSLWVDKYQPRSASEIRKFEHTTFILKYA